MIRQTFNLKSDSPNARRDVIGTVFFTVLLLATLYGVFRILQPYMHAIIMAALLASVFSPIYGWILARVGQRKNVAAGISVGLVALVVVVPIILFTSSLLMRGIDAYRQAESWLTPTNMNSMAVDAAPTTDSATAPVAAAPSTDSAAIGPPVVSTDTDAAATAVTDTDVAAAAIADTDTASFTVSPRFMQLKAEHIDPLLKSATGRKLVAFQRAYMPWESRGDRPGLRDRLIDTITGLIASLQDSALSLLGNVFSAIMSFVLMLFTMFYFFRDGSEWIDRMLDFSPLSEEHEQRLLDNIKKVARSSILGTVLTAVAQGGLGAIAFGICGIPWMFYGVLMGFTSMVPVVGTALIWIPAVLYLLVMGKFGLAIFLAIWCVVVVGLADNFLRPALMKGDTGMSSAILFFAILGGISLFGLIGVIYGPLVFGIFWVLLQIYDISTKIPTDPDLTDADAGAGDGSAPGGADDGAPSSGTASPALATAGGASPAAATAGGASPAATAIPLAAPASPPHTAKPPASKTPASPAPPPPDDDPAAATD